MNRLMRIQCATRDYVLPAQDIIVDRARGTLSLNIPDSEGNTPLVLNWQQVMNIETV